MFSKNTLLFICLYAVTTIAEATSPPPPRAESFDYDYDGVADIVLIDTTNDYEFQVLNSSGSNSGSSAEDGVQRYQIGFRPGDIPISGDFDGDGRWDVGFRRPSSLEWVIRRSGRGSIERTVFGLQKTDIPVPADYDGDGITDIAFRRASNSTWYIKNSSGVDSRTGNEDGISRVVFGMRTTDIPVPADYDGDGKADIAVRRDSNRTWYIQNSSGSNFNSDREDGIQRVVFGRSYIGDDIPVPADYDGDGKADIAFRRKSNGTWYVLNSSGSNYNSDRGDGIQRIVFGIQPSDTPVLGDYDGDRIADVAFRRDSNSLFYALNSGGTNFNSDRNDVIQRIEFGTYSTHMDAHLGPLQVFEAIQSIEDDVTYRLIHEGDPGGIEVRSKRFVVIKNQRFYEMELLEKTFENALDIDFERESVLLLDMGYRFSGAFSVRVDSITDRDNHVEVEVVTTLPGTCGATQAITQPFKFYRINTTKEIVIQESIDTNDC